MIGELITSKLTKFGQKSIKAFIDNYFRTKVIPVEGSVLYCDLYFGIEHSGIYVGENLISNIAVKGFAEGTVELSDPEDFIDRSFLYKKIYVSCNEEGAVGNDNVSKWAKHHVGEESFYGLVIKNCHQFSEKCVNYSENSYENKKFLGGIFSIDNEIVEWEPTIKSLKNRAKEKLGATKWRLWDWKNQEEKDEEEIEEEQKRLEKESEEFWKNLPLNEENIELIKKEIENIKEYISEISDENLPQKALNTVNFFTNTLEEVKNEYEKAKEFIILTGCGYSYNDLKIINENSLDLTKEMENNKKIKEVLKRLGREYISKDKKLRPKVLKRTNNEVMGIHKSNDLTRLLPSELVNFESEELEFLFYTKFLENSLLTYEIMSKDSDYTSNKKEEYFEDKNKGPVIACLDTSGSMNGKPILKAKALLLSICKILEKENRSLYIILFGGVGEIKELNITKKAETNKVLPFLNSGFGGGTDFETPLKKGLEIINLHKEYNKADILMITDGYCNLNEEFIKYLNIKKQEIDFSIYSIICENGTFTDTYSDEIINI